MSAAALLARLRSLGIELQTDGRRIRWRPKDSVGPELSDVILAHRAALIPLLSAPSVPDAPGPASWDTAHADATLAAINARIDSFKAQPWRTEVQRKVLEVLREVFTRYHAQRDPLLWEGLADLSNQIGTIWGAAAGGPGFAVR